MSGVKPIPDGYHSVQPYLMFKNCEHSIAFYRKAFGAKERLRIPKAGGGIGHAEVQIGDSTVMMADEAPQMDAMSVEHFGGSPANLLIYTEDCDGMYKQAVEAGGISLREPADQPYGDRIAGVKDPFGFKWWIATHIKDVPLEEMSAQS